MKLLAKFNIILIITFLIGLLISALYSYKLTNDNALKQVTDQAELIMQQALAVRSYSVKEVRPLVKGDTSKFHPQTVPAYAATQVANIVRKDRPNYIYKEAVFNPTNLRDQATIEEKAIINGFIQDSSLKKQVGTISSVDGKSLFVAYPIKITNRACLTCHSKPGNAPAAMRAIYGDKNGYGWKLNEVVGTQLVSVPFKLPAELAKKTFYSFLISLTLVFVTLFIVIKHSMVKLVKFNRIRVSTNFYDS